MKYCRDIHQTKRFATRRIFVGNVPLGADEPIRIQSMTTSNTRDVDATVNQIIQLADAGCEIVRLTVQGKKEAESCEKIKAKLLQKGYTTPLVADIHFYPPAALLVSEFVDKVRINPGNFVDRRASFQIIQYDDETYQKEIVKIEEGFSPLVEKCKRFNKAMRLGTNHGSLSDRIMNRFGDTPQGMVESAFEYARICRKYDYHNFCFSMKASNPLVMIQAYRLLASEMIRLGWDYPIHLGVTEAGEGEDGRLKSSVGIGSLLLDGIGDTIRVSLTEDPWKEIEPCRKLIDLANRKSGIGIDLFEESRDFMHLQRREVKYFSPLNEKGSVLTREGDRLLCDGLEVNEDDIHLIREEKSLIHEVRKKVGELKLKKDTKPLILDLTSLKLQDPLMDVGAQAGLLLCDLLSEGVLVEKEEFGLNLLQACRMRMSKTDYISCPGCGRTLFDLQTVSSRIREKTAHLPGVKIAIMGCIVNGPGEMADADFGYVGSKPGKIDLYIGKKVAQRDIDFEEAEDRLIELIRSEGKWTELSSV